MEPYARAKVSLKLPLMEVILEFRVQDVTDTHSALLCRVVFFELTPPCGDTRKFEAQPKFENGLICFLA
jgi:hypothetical protein